MNNYICKVIAEIGSTWHRPTPELFRQAALDSIRTAAKCGADIIKFQMLTADGPWSKERALDKWEATRPYWLPPEWLPSLQTLAHSTGVEFWMSLFDLKTVNRYARFCDGLKLASGELAEMSKPFLLALAKQAERLAIPLAISTGTHTEVEVMRALDWLSNFNIEIILMNCVSKYPAEVDDYNLLWPLKYRGRVTLGLSDHTLDIDLVSRAVELGYVYFEKHFRLGDTPPDNPDFGHSLPPDKLERYVKAIRWSESIWLGIEKQLAPGEEDELIWMQRGSDGKRPRDA